MTCHPNPDPKCQNQTKGWNNQSYEDWIQDECKKNEYLKKLKIL